MTAVPLPVTMEDQRLMATPPTTPAAALSIESIVAVDAPREYRLHPRDRVVAYTAEAAGARQLFTLSLRGGYPTQLTASDKDVSDPQWSPDGRRLAYVRDDEIWVIEADGSRRPRVVAKPGGGREPRWSPDGHRIAFMSRRRGWSQVWLIDAPVPRRGRPATRAEAAAADGPDRERGRRRSVRVGAGRRAGIAVMAASSPRTRPRRPRSPIVDVATGRSRGRRRRATAIDTGARWLPDGSILYVSDADGWFQVVRLTADGHDRIVLTGGEREHGEPCGGVGYVAAAVARRRRFVHVEVHDGLQDLRRRRAGRRPRAPKRGRGRPPKTPRTVAARRRPGSRINPWDGVWRSVGWLPDGAWVAAIGERETAPQDLWLLPVPGVAPEDARPRQVTDSLPAVLRAALAPGRAPAAERIAFTARDGLRVEGTLWRPTTRDGQARRQARARRSSTRTAARPARRSARSSRSSSCSSPRASPSSTSTSAGRPATAARSASPTTTSGATPTSTTSSTPRAGPPSSPGRMAGWRSTAARTAATWSCARSSRSRRCGGPAWTCTATRRSPRAIATATVSAGSISTR